MTKVILFNKPFNVLCQFSPHENKDTLKKHIDVKGYYPCGRLDFDSEGLLVLSDNGNLQALIAEPKFKMEKTYLVQIEGEISEQALNQLKSGVLIKGEKTKQAKATRIEEPTDLWPREPPIRERKNIPTSWIRLTITEGKNRQVRKMTAAVGYPTLRLIRSQIGAWKIGNLAPGEWRYAELPEATKQRLQERMTKKANKPYRTKNQHRNHKKAENTFKKRK